MGKPETYPELRTVIYELLFNGKSIPYVATNPYIKDAAMFGFIRNENERAVISNRIFKSVLYNNFIAEKFVTSKMYDAGERERSTIPIIVLVEGIIPSIKLVWPR